MKRHLKNIVLTAGLSVLLGSSTLSAQSQKAVASIPFAYHVGQQTFSPGKYAVGETRAPGVFALRETDTGHEIFMPVVQLDPRYSEMKRPARPRSFLSTLRFGVAALCGLALPVSAQTIDVTVDWSSPTGISSTATSFGLNAQRTDPNIVGLPGNPIYKSRLGAIGAEYLRVWGGQWQDSTVPDGWLYHMGKPDERWDSEKIKRTFRDYAPYGPKHIMVEIGSWPDYMADPTTGKLEPRYYEDFANFCADLVRIINRENPGGRHVDMFEVLNEREGYYQNPGDGLIMGHIVAIAASAMKTVDPTIKVGGPAYSWAVQPETKNFIQAAGKSINFISWHEYATGPDQNGDVAPTSQVWASGHEGKADPSVETIRQYIRQGPNPALQMYVDEYAINWMCWQPFDNRCSNATEAVYDGLKVVSYLHGGATGSAKWNESDDTYGVMSGPDGGFAYRPAAYLFRVLNHHFIGREVLATTTDGTEVVPFAIRHKNDRDHDADDSVIGSVLLIHSVENITDNVNLTLQNWSEPPEEVIVRTITDSGLTTTTMPFTGDFSLTLPATSVTALIFERR